MIDEHCMVAQGADPGRRGEVRISSLGNPNIVYIICSLIIKTGDGNITEFSSTGSLRGSAVVAAQ